MASPNIEVIENALHAFNLFHQAGCSVPEWCANMGYKNIVIYTEKEYYDLVEPIVLSFRFYRRENVFLRSSYSKEPFVMKYFFAWDHGQFSTQSIDVAHTDKDAVVLMLAPDDNDIYRRFQGLNVKIYRISELIREIQFYLQGRRILDNFMSSHRDVTILVYAPPIFPESELSEWEKKIVAYRPNIERLAKSIMKKEEVNPIDKEAFLFGDYQLSDSDIIDVSTVPSSYFTPLSVRKFKDKQSGCVNLQNGHRITINQPSNPLRTIYIVGHCADYGFGIIDSETYASRLQVLLNEKYPQKRFCVENYAIFVGARYEDKAYILHDLPVKENDIIIYAGHFLRPKVDVQYYYADLSNLFSRPHNNGELFYDRSHPNSKGNSLIAEALMGELVKYNFFESQQVSPKQNTILPVPRYGIPWWADKISEKETRVAGFTEQLFEYKKTCREEFKKAIGHIGAIVMNCNPFTLGHQYLIEYAAQQVKHLFIFVVEEDKSIFPFKDRFELVKTGTADIENVTVLPSGEFIISSLTFSDYFNKSELQDHIIDPSQDVELFAKEIAPSLGITVRFAGEEPLDTVTKQYNQTMARILPQYGIDFEVILRKESDGTPISASRVRALLKEGSFNEIAKLVPKTTFEYLKEKTGGGDHCG
jgi:[citrate (pro-3S)-lyase] ligase